MGRSPQCGRGPVSLSRVKIVLSDEALAEFERLERDEPERFLHLADDLAMLDLMTIDDVPTLASIGSLLYLQGPTGRVYYWVGRDEERVIVEYFDLD